MRPWIKVLLTTGYREPNLAYRDMGDAGYEVIQKPYRRSELAQAVWRALDAPGAPS